MVYMKKKRIMRCLAAVLTASVLLGTSSIPVGNLTAYAAETDEAAEVPQDVEAPDEPDTDDEEVVDDQEEGTVSGNDMVTTDDDEVGDIPEEEPAITEVTPEELTVPDETAVLETPEDEPADVTGDDVVADAPETPESDVPEDTTPDISEEEEPDVTDEIPDEADVVVPEAVQAFLDAVAGIPEITAENASEVSEYLYDEVAASYEALLGTEYEDREDVQEAARKMATAMELLDEMMGMDVETFTNTSFSGTVDKTAIAYDFQQFSWSTDFSYDGANYYVVTTKGTAVIDDFDGVYDEGIPNLYPRGGVVVPNPGSYRDVFIQGADDIVNVDVTWDGSRLKIDFKPGSKTGKTTVKVDISFSYTTTGSYGGTTAYGNLYLWYDVTNNVGVGSTPVEKPDPPTYFEIQDFGTDDSIAVIIRCKDEDTYIPRHMYRCSKIYDGSFSVGTVMAYDGYREDLSTDEWSYICNVYIDQQYYLNLLNDKIASQYGIHYLYDDTEEVIAPFYYFNGGYCSYAGYSLDAGWYCLTEDAPLYVYVTEDNQSGDNVYTEATIKKTADVTECFIGDKVTYTIEITNAGDGPVSGVMTDGIPWGAEFVSADVSDVVYDDEEYEITWAINDLSPGDTVRVNVVMEVVNGSGYLNNAAYFEYDGKKIGDSASTLIKSLPKVLDFTKTRLTEVPEELGLSGINTDETVWIEKDVYWKNVQTDCMETLLYALIVTGDPGAEYKITDEGAMYVGGDPMSGTIPESGKAVVYVTRTYTVDDIQDDVLVNTAYCNNIEATVDTPAVGYRNVERYLNKCFRTTAGDVLNIPSDFYIECQSLFGDIVSSVELRLDDAVIDESTQTIYWHYFMKASLSQDTYTQICYIEHNADISGYEWSRVQFYQSIQCGWSDTVSPTTICQGSPDFAIKNLYTSHAHVYIITEQPDCIHPGREVCDCGDEREVPPLGHDFTGADWTDNHEGGHDDTCDSTDHVRVCTRCNGTLVDGEEIQTEDHNFSEWEVITEPICTIPGEEKRVCEDCGHAETREIAPLGHDFDGVPWEDDNEDGLHKDDCESTEHVRDCKRCHGTEEGGTERAEHPYGDWYIVTEPTCTTPGLEQRECLVCDHVETRVVEKLGHDLVTEPGEEPDCIHDGLTDSVYCSRCDYVESEPTVIPALGHDFEEVTWVDNDGKGHTEDCDSAEHRMVCKRCDGTLVDGEEIRSAEHVYGEWVTLKEPNCTEDGLKERYCKDCDHKEQETIPMTGHTMVTTEGVEPDCIHDGLTEGSCCEICGYTEILPEVIPALGHDFEDVVWVDNHGGGHTDDCRSEDHVRVCKRCDGTLVDGEESQTEDHAFAEWVVVKEPTEDGDGLRERICSVCGHKESEVIPMLVPDEEPDEPEETPEPDPTPAPEEPEEPEDTPTPDPTPVPEQPVPTPVPTPEETPVTEETPEETPVTEETPEEIPVSTPEPTPVATPVPEPEPVAPTPTEEPDIELEPDDEPPVISEVEAAPEVPEEDVIGDEPVPMGTRDGDGRAWALVNYFLMNVALFESVMLLIGYFVQVKKAKKRKDDAKEKSKTEQRRKLERNGHVRILSIVVGIIALVAFILTEDIWLPLTFVDKWTPLMLLIAIVQTVVVIFSRKEEKPAYRVVFVNGEGGTISAETEEYVEPGEKVLMTVTTDMEYLFKSFEILKGEITVEDMQFDMPESDVVIRGIFEKQ